MIGIILIAIGLLGIIVNKSRLKQVLSLNVMALGVVLFLIRTGSLMGSEPPLKGFIRPVDPLPAVLMLTTLVVDVAVTGLALGLLIGGSEE
ncbi:NADH-quinone oxidoreductase subunit K [Pyrococcus sp. ST04]|uniref:NADH-quinone oxidoreductase subunit K n=1 Tax=Pyrococcus sp. ST04 TaxID=1183377 RepID=UPI0002605FE5|nr:NADH-quinone oxidoreductase subunit K [Pyrococcus sp. ST04]AFK22732.1 putative monovalent cation/H+ antiporter subunit [Pyrococcus sp. ST04]